MTDNRTDRPYWCEICARKKECYGITLKPKCFVPTADRKTEPTISKMEQVEDDAYFLELMGAVERGEISDAGANQAWYEYINHKDEPTTQTETQNSNLTFEKADEPQTEPLQTCSVNGRPYDCGNCEYFRCTADEPQTERPCDNCQEWDCYGCDYKQKERSK